MYRGMAGGQRGWDRALSGREVDAEKEQEVQRPLGRAGGGNLWNMPIGQYVRTLGFTLEPSDDFEQRSDMILLLF